MGKYLIIRLEAPLMSFGNLAVDNRRPTGPLPGASMITGLLANALGYTRLESDRLDRLQERIRYAARAEIPGEDILIVEDFQTVQLRQSDTAWTTRRKPETRGGSPATYQSNHIKTAQYLADVRVTIAITLLDPAEAPTVQDLAQALLMPARPVFIGRQSCPPAAPLFAGIVEATHATAALHTTPPRRSRRCPIQWDEPGPHHESVSEVRSHETSDRRDWRNAIHVGRRTIQRGIVAANAPEVLS